ncbi:hypothetical protein GC176_26870 [bacterium]|nr:hypothetical protein [bacterium]
MSLFSRVNEDAFDRLSRRVALAGVVLLVFAAGALALHFRMLPTFVLEALQVADDWQGIKDEETQQQKLDKIDRKPKNMHPVSRAKVEVWDKALSYGDYTLITARNEDKAFLVNMEGKIVRSWPAYPKELLMKENDEAQQRIFGRYASLYPNGDILITNKIRGETPYSRSMVKLDKDGKLLWHVEQIHHVVYIDKENGTIYALEHEFLKARSNLALGMPQQILTDYVMILSPEGTPLDKISILDAFLGTPFEIYLYSKVDDENKNAQATQRVAWDRFHTNSIMKLEPEVADKFPMFKPGQLLLSIRSMSLLAVLDPATKKITWAMKGPWYVQHDAVFLPNGNMTVFDNMGQVLGEKITSRAMEFSVQDSAIHWSYSGTAKHPLLSVTFGNVQRLPNGNSLINETNNGRVIEVTKEGRIVWNFILPGDRIGDLSPCSINSAIRYRKDELPFLKTDM